MMTLEAARKFNLVGRTHEFLSRKTLQTKHEALLVTSRPSTCRDVFTYSVKAHAFAGARIARKVACPATVAMDAVFSNGRGRPLKEHPCDLGLARACLAAAACTLPFFIYELACVGVIAGLHTLMMACGVPETAALIVAILLQWVGFFSFLTVSDIVDRNAQWDDRYATAKKIMRVPGYVLVGPSLALLYLSKQVLGLTTAGIKAAITGVGGAVGALVGIVVGTYQAYRLAHVSPTVSPGSVFGDKIHLERQFAVNAETFVEHTPLSEVPDARWFAVYTASPTGDVVHGFDCRELAEWIAFDAGRGNGAFPWKNPHTRSEMTVEQCVALASHTDAATREAVEHLLPPELRDATEQPGRWNPAPERPPLRFRGHADEDWSVFRELCL